MAYADIVILALIAGFVLLRLRSVLGQKTGFEGSPYAERKREAETPMVRVAEAAARLRQVVEDRDAGLVAAVENPQAREALAAIKAADADFTVEHFLQGARHAFEMTFDAFVKGDRETLSMLLAPPILEIFNHALDERAAEPKHTDTTLLAVQSQEIIGAELQKNIARIRVRFVSEQVTVIRDKDGTIVEGDPSASHTVEDEWVFERDIHSKNPNWKIIET